MESEAPKHEPGEEFGPYRLEKPLGRGAAAEVWEVVETGAMGFTKRQALKLLQPPPGEMETQKKALINEARVCGHLKHPGVVDVYGVGEQNGELYIAMEFVDGPDLNTLLVALRRRGVEIPVGAALDAAIDLAEALDYAHLAQDDVGEPLNIVHRDLKPSNVLVDRRGLLKISDWGLVKSTLNIESTTRGIVKGTPGYIAPEVWGGTRDFRPTADLFAVGAMLYEFIVGERLFQGRNLARIAEQVARRKPEEEAARAAERCPEVVPVLTRLLQRVPTRRHQTAAELVDDLRGVRDHYTARETLKKFLRGVSEVLDEVAPSRAGSSRLRSMPAKVEEDAADPLSTDRSPAQLNPEAAAPPPPAPPRAAPAPSRPAPRKAAPAPSAVPATRQMEPRSMAGDESVSSVDLSADDSLEADASASSESLAPVSSGEAPRRRRRKRPPGARTESARVRAPRRAPPPTVAVLIAVLGALTLLLGFLAVLLTN
jgi:serine/threonine protein kinase